MPYSKSLPPIVITICKWFNAACCLFTLTVCLDIFILPPTTVQEKIIKRQERYHTGRNMYSNRSYKTQLDHVFLITENNRYAYYRAQTFNPREADSARVVTTMLFNIVKTAYVKAGGVERELKKQDEGKFDTSIIVPIVFVLIAAFGVIMWNNTEQVLNAAVTNLIIIIIQLWMSGYI